MFDWMIDFVVQLTPIANSLGVYMYLIVLMVAILESTPLIGTFTPGTLVLLFFGFLVSLTHIELIPCILVATLGAILGDCIAYVIGRYGSKLFKENKSFLKLSHLDAGKAFFSRHGGKSVIIGRFIGPIRPVVPMVAGLVHLSMRRFIPLNLAGALIWTTTIISTGAYVGKEWQQAEHILSIVGIVLAIVAMAYIGKWFITERMDMKNS